MDATAIMSHGIFVQRPSATTAQVSEVTQTLYLGSNRMGPNKIVPPHLSI